MTPPIKTKIKICGLSQATDIEAANRLGVDMVGFVFHKESPRYVEGEQAAYLAAACAPTIERVALLVDPEDKDIEAAVASCNPHYIQLHGQESPTRCVDIGRRYPAAIIKALPLVCPADLEQVTDYENTHTNSCAGFLFDSPPSNSDQGGTGKVFDWNILKGFTSQKMWIVAGGLTAANVGAALAITNAPIVDVSSGVEQVRGKKDAQLMADFVEAVREKGLKELHD